MLKATRFKFYGILVSKFLWNISFKIQSYVLIWNNWRLLFQRPISSCPYFRIVQILLVCSSFLYSWGSMDILLNNSQHLHLIVPIVLSDLFVFPRQIKPHSTYSSFVLFVWLWILIPNYMLLNIVQIFHF